MRSGKTFRQSGFTLAELIIAMASSTLLVAGMGSAIFIAIQSTEEDTVAGDTIDGTLLVDEIAEDLRAATSFRERTATSVTFNVADRDGDTFPEVIRYSWSGSAGDPLYRTQNGTQVEIVESVASLSFGYTTETRPLNGRVLFVFGNGSLTPNGDDLFKINTMAGWGYEAILIPSTYDQSEFDWRAALVDVAYVSETLDSGNLNTKLKSAGVGVLIEEGSLFDDNDGFALADVDGSEFDGSTIDLIDNGHYITSPLSVGTLTIALPGTGFRHMNPNFALGLQILARKSGDSSKNTMAIVNTGDRLFDNSLAAGPRVALPWGKGGFDPTDLNSTGLDLWHRALDWAARKYVVSSVEVTLQLGDASDTSVATEVDILSRPQA